MNLLFTSRRKTRRNNRIGSVAILPNNNDGPLGVSQVTSFSPVLFLYNKDNKRKRFLNQQHYSEKERHRRTRARFSVYCFCYSSDREAKRWVTEYSRIGGGTIRKCDLLYKLISKTSFSTFYYKKSQKGRWSLSWKQNSKENPLRSEAYLDEWPGWFGRKFYQKYIK